MSTERKSILAGVMSLVWQFVKRNGFTMSEALKYAWANMKLKAAMRTRIVKFWFIKVSGETREDQSARWLPTKFVVTRSQS